MAYVLEEITPADQEKILKDAECDEMKKAPLVTLNYFEYGRPIWVIDRERDSYLFWGPKPAKVNYARYYFFFNKFLYVLRVKRGENVIHFEDMPILESFLLHDLKQAIKEAFSVYPFADFKKTDDHLVSITFFEGN
jgi:hypothetical protein